MSNQKNSLFSGLNSGNVECPSQEYQEFQVQNFDHLKGAAAAAITNSGADVLDKCSSFIDQVDIDRKDSKYLRDNESVCSDSENSSSSCSGSSSSDEDSSCDNISSKSSLISRVGDGAECQYPLKSKLKHGNMQQQASDQQGPSIKACNSLQRNERIEMMVSMDETIDDNKKNNVVSIKNPANTAITNNPYKKNSENNHCENIFDTGREDVQFVASLSLQNTIKPDSSTATFQRDGETLLHASNRDTTSALVGKRFCKDMNKTIRQNALDTSSPIDEDEWKPTKFEAKVLQFTHQSIRKRKIRVQDFFGQKLGNFFLFQFLNDLQTEVAHALTSTDENIVVAAPTGAGKTCIFDMAMMRLFNTSMGNRSISTQNKVVYIAPNKALCDERMNDWNHRFNRLNMGIKVGLLTGDVWDTSEAFYIVASSHIILSTPEKWDSVTRRWTDHLNILRCIKLLLVDEIHLLGDETRGPCLETVICRMKSVSTSSDSKVIKHQTSR